MRAVLDGLEAALLPIYRANAVHAADALAQFKAALNEIDVAWAERLVEARRLDDEARRAHDEEVAREKALAAAAAAKAKQAAADAQAAFDAETAARIAAMAAQGAWAAEALGSALAAAMPDASMHVWVGQCLPDVRDVASRQRECDLTMIALRVDVMPAPGEGPPCSLEMRWYRDPEMLHHCGGRIFSGWKRASERISAATRVAADAWLATLASGQTVLPDYVPTAEDVRRGQVADARKALAAQMTAAAERAGESLPWILAQRYESVMDSAAQALAATKGSSREDHVRHLSRLTAEVAAL
jgi:hypothetical protein